MKFIDEAKIYVRGGHGGRGCVSFRREKFAPRGGPNGGDGGKGGNVIVKASGSHHTLLDLKYKQHHIAKNGGHGGGSNRTGKEASDIEIIVPVGTLVKNAQTGELLADLIVHGQQHIIAHGGRGGKGNAWFATSTNQTPRYAQEGMQGEEYWLLLELKLLADIGIIGLPNVGKSTFISRISAARPKIADYPFTTVVPNLGVVRYGDNESFVVADIPGLIKGAHEGMGMGTRFLRHIERTSVLLHILDISSEDYVDAWQNYEIINKELFNFCSALMEKPQIVTINKIDLPTTKERLKKEIDTFAQKGIEVFEFSAITGEGIKSVVNEMANKLLLSAADRSGKGG
jgi:GTP-binding protein